MGARWGWQLKSRPRRLCGHSEAGRQASWQTPWEQSSFCVSIPMFVLAPTPRHWNILGELSTCDTPPAPFIFWNRLPLSCPGWPCTMVLQREEVCARDPGALRLDPRSGGIWSSCRWWVIWKTEQLPVCVWGAVKGKRSLHCGPGQGSRRLRQDSALPSLLHTPRCLLVSTWVCS